MSPKTLKQFGWWYVTATGYGPSSMFAFWIALVLLGVFKWSHDQAQRWLTRVIVLYPICYGAFLYVGKAPPFEWYLAPVTWCGLLLAAAGLHELAAMCASHLRTPLPAGRLRAFIMIVVCLIYWRVHNTDLAEGTRRFQANEDHMRGVVGLLLRDNTPVDSIVLMEAIGYQGFHCRRTIIDLAGLVSPSVVRLRKESSSGAETFQRILSELNPDYIVLRSFEVEKNESHIGGRLFDNPAQKEYFLSHYKELKRFSAPYPEVWGPRAHLTVFGGARHPGL